MGSILKDKLNMFSLDSFAGSPVVGSRSRKNWSICERVLSVIASILALTSHTLDVEI